MKLSQALDKLVFQGHPKQIFADLSLYCSETAISEVSPSSLGTKRHFLQMVLFVSPEFLISHQRLWIFVCPGRRTATTTPGPDSTRNSPSVNRKGVLLFYKETISSKSSYPCLAETAVQEVKGISTTVMLSHKLTTSSSCLTPPSPDLLEVLSPLLTVASPPPWMIL